MSDFKSVFKQMVSDKNPLDNLITILNTNYIILNTDNITPTIAKIYTKPSEKEPRPGEDFIYLYSELTSIDKPGMILNNSMDIRESIKIDIRSRPAMTNQATKIADTHARKVLTEVRRIIYSKIVSPDSNFDIIEPQIDITDLSNGSKGIFRYVIRLTMVSFNRDIVT